MRNRFEVLTFRLEDLNAKIEELNRKAAKLKLPLIETRVLAVQFPYKFWTGERHRWAPGRTTVEVLGERPKLAGYRFVGTLEHLEKTNVIRAVPGEEVPVVYRDRPALCEHCNTVRRRKDSYLVLHEETRRYVQLGRACVRDFLGGTSPQALAAYLEILREVEGLSGEAGFGGFGSVYQVSLRELLELSASAIRTHGWVSKTLAMEKGMTSTASLILLNLRPDPAARDYLRKHPEDELSVNPEDVAVAEATDAWVKTLVGNESTYLHNLGALFTSKIEIEMFGRDVGLAASAVSAYLRAQDLLKKQKAEPEPESNFVGEPGKRQLFELEFLRSRMIPSDFVNNFKVLEFKDASHNLMVWFTGTLGSDAFEPGKRYEVKATVKRHQEYRGKKQTVLTRCSLVKYIEGGGAQ